MLDTLINPMRFERRRESSWNRTGANMDSTKVNPGDELVLGELDGPGIVKHLWFTMAAQDRDHLRQCQLTFRWDGAETPAVDVPFGDFFCLNQGVTREVVSAPIVVTQTPFWADPGRGGYNCYFPMPFHKNAELRFRNGCERPIQLYYYVDWEKHASLTPETRRFRATFNSERTTTPEGTPPLGPGDCPDHLTNPSDDENYVFLDAQGEGHYVGTSMGVHARTGEAGRWWEGDDMFAIDDEPWPPRLHGTGAEDYFNMAYGFRKEFSTPFHGISTLIKENPNQIYCHGRFAAYRFHIADPIPFTTSIRASIEHGHANSSEHDYRSVAYWYAAP